jgi:hypothetical protein
MALDLIADEGDKVLQNADNEAACDGPSRTGDASDQSPSKTVKQNTGHHVGLEIDGGREEGLAEVVGDEELTGGDFVRTMKQLVDLARQVALVAPEAATRTRASEVATRAFRGVVADSVLGATGAGVTG